MSPVSEAFPVRKIADVEPRPASKTWLVDQLWLSSGVGIVGGQPKSFKTWVAAELALAVAAGSRALGRFEAKVQGPVLVFAAEDDPPAMRTRFESVAKARSVRLDRLPIMLIDLPFLRLDHPDHIQRLRRTIEQHRPRLLVLDPFVRLVRLDENSAQDVSAVLGDLRTIQRAHEVAVLLVHHMRKSPSSHPGQQLRGSGDFAAWTDSALYITRRAEERHLLVEHRSAPAPDPLLLRLELEPSPHLTIQERGQPSTISESVLHAAIIERLASSPRACSTPLLREHLRVRKSTLLEALKDLSSRGIVQRHQDGWKLGSAAPRP